MIKNNNETFLQFAKRLLTPENITEYGLQEIYRLLFGAGENFEIYEGNELFYFVPQDKNIPTKDFKRLKLVAKQIKKQKGGIKFLPLIALNNVYRI